MSFKNMKCPTCHGRAFNEIKGKDGDYTQTIYECVGCWSKWAIVHAGAVMVEDSQENSFLSHGDSQAEGDIENIDNLES